VDWGKAKLENVEKQLNIFIELEWRKDCPASFEGTTGRPGDVGALSR
jgi:hypothetical protein